MAEHGLNPTFTRLDQLRVPVTISTRIISA